MSKTDAVGMFLAAGFDVSVPPDRKSDSDLLVRHDGHASVVQVRVRQRTIYAWDADQLLLNTRERVLVVVPTASRGLIDTAKRDSRLSVASVSDRRLIWDGHDIPLPGAVRNADASERVPGRRRNPWGRWAVMRAYLLDEEARSQTELAWETGITQPAVSKSNTALGGLLIRSAGGWKATDRSILWDTFMAEYPGPNGFTTYWYGLDAVSEQSKAVVAAGAAAGVKVLISGDSAADVLAPWRIPARAVVYATSSIALERLGFAQTSAERATLELTVPADHTVWATAASWVRRTGVATVDPVIAAWDVARSGGPDAEDAVKRIREFVLKESPAR